MEHDNQARADAAREQIAEAIARSKEVDEEVRQRRPRVETLYGMDDMNRANEAQHAESPAERIARLETERDSLTARLDVLDLELAQQIHDAVILEDDPSLNELSSWNE